MESAIFVKTVEGETLTIPYIENMTGKKVKSRVKAIKGITIEQQSLIATGREIADDDSLTDYGITKGSTV
jgi:hypothetical protein